MPLRIEADAEPIPGYKLVDRLGSGGFGEVWKCVAPGGIHKAIKVIHGDLRNRETDAFRFAEQELKSLKRVKQVRHPYLLALDRYDVVDGRLLITMELADCNLWDRFRQCRRQGLPGIPRDELLQYMRETAEVLDLFDEKFKLQHLDIKPQNLFLLYNHVKVADFGQVKDLEGLMAQVTGGITPVYAAPETFDGIVSQYCDQYSLACVYQELLTGQRPFDGTSMQQLLMQHLQMPPNLDPAPPCDRAALKTALAKDYKARFPSVGAFVRALSTGGGVPVAAAEFAPRLETAVVGSGDGGTDGHAAASRFVNSLSDFPPPPPGGTPSETTTPGPRASFETAPPPDRVAPPLETGPGCLRPTVIVGLGFTGKQVLQAFKRNVQDRFGPLSNTPLVRLLYIDTDADALASAAEPEGLAEEEIFPAKLNRPAHYLKPRLGGRAIGDGWFDTQLLYKLPRNPTTLGYRALGRLAVVDHYRSLAPRIQAAVEAAVEPEALARTAAATGQELATNRPQVVVVAGLGGGTGSGMLLDVAYAARQRLRRLGYAQADVVGVLMVPPDQADPSAQVQANTYATLTELHHYSREGTAFTATYDERSGSVRELDPPFSEVVLLPGLRTDAASANTQVNWGRTPPRIQSPQARSSGTVGRSGTHRLTAARDATPRPADVELANPTHDAAEYLRLSLFTPAGPLLAKARPAARPDLPMPARAAGVSGLGWPRASVVARLTRVLTPVLVNHWVNPDPTQVREVIPKWTHDQWQRHGLAPAALKEKLVQTASSEFNVDLGAEADACRRLAQARGWLSRAPDPEAVGRVAWRWQEFFGRPHAPAHKTYPGLEAFKASAERVSADLRTAFADLGPALVETPLFRLAGTEEAIRQLVAALDRAARECEAESATQGKEAAAALDQLLAYAHHQKGMRRPTPAELAEALETYPTGQLGHVAARAAAHVYRAVREVLVGIQAEIAPWRQRIEACLPALAADAELPAQPRIPGELLPPGCQTPEDAAQRFLKSLSDDDLADLDLLIQAGLEERFGGLYQAGLNASLDPHLVIGLLQEQTRLYLDERLGEVDLAAMLFARSGGPGGAAYTLASVADRATPAVVGGGPWARVGGTVYVGPQGAGGDPIRDLAHAALPQGAEFAEAPDEVAIVREYAEVPLSALAQLGPAWAGAYKAHDDLFQASSHSRLDVTRWADVDSA